MAEKSLTLQSSNEELKKFFKTVCLLTNSTVSYLGYEVDGDHLYFNFSNGGGQLSEFDVLAAISITPVEEVNTMLPFKGMIDKLVPKSNATYHTLSFTVDVSLMDKLSALVINGKPAKKSKTYLMTDSATGFTKIGKANDCVARERTLQSEKPTISILAVCENDVEVELHRRFKGKRLRGEWFNLTKGEIKEIINEYDFHNWNNNRKPKI